MKMYCRRMGMNFNIPWNQLHLLSMQQWMAEIMYMMTVSILNGQKIFIITKL